MYDHRARHERAVRSGIEIVFDSERGVHVAVGLPGLFFHEGSFYRQASDGWQTSARADGGWEPTRVVPSNVRNAWQPGPASLRQLPRRLRAALEWRPPIARVIVALTRPTAAAPRGRGLMLPSMEEED